jgi:hypothetical protein
MFSILLANQKFMRFVKLATIGAATVLMGSWLSASPVQADQYGGFDETGHYQYGSGPHSSPYRPSIGQSGYEQLRQQQEREDLQSNQDQLRRYHEAPAVGSPRSGGNKYNFYEPTYLPDGKVLMCAKGFHGATYCN